MIAFLATLVVMTYIVREVKINVTTAGVTTASAVASQWLVPIGVIVTLAVGGLLSLRHPQPAEQSALTDPAELSTSSAQVWQ